MVYQYPKEKIKALCLGTNEAFICLSMKDTSVLSPQEFLPPNISGLLEMLLTWMTWLLCLTRGARCQQVPQPGPRAASSLQAALHLLNSLTHSPAYSSLPHSGSSAPQQGCLGLRHCDLGASSLHAHTQMPSSCGSRGKDALLPSVS